ncbi:MAG TPA: phosphotransferase [Chloroflexota bacterium]
MRTLPDNPNLDHLRQQAKDLLAGLRDAEPRTSLTAAQTALAQQYGFPRWADLKAEVDRRHGTADLADGNAIAARYRLGNASGSMRSVARADEIGRPWLLQTDRGRWAVRQLDGCYDVANAETDVLLQEAALGAGIVLPRPVRSTSGAIVESIAGHNWRVHKWIDSGPPLTAPVAASIAHQVGAILAKLHALALPAPGAIGFWHTHRQTETQWRDLSQRAHEVGASWADDLANAIPSLLDLSAIGSADPPPSVLCHCNLGPGNVRVSAGGQLAVLGWEHAGALPPAWELGSALMAWAMGPGNEPLNVAAARALLDGYGAHPPLEPAMFQASVAGWLNYLFGQASLALTTKHFDDWHHAERMVRHMLAHPPDPARLRQLLEAAPVMS